MARALKTDLDCFGRNAKEMRFGTFELQIKSQGAEFRLDQHYDIIWDCRFPSRKRMNELGEGSSEHETLVTQTRALLDASNFGTLVYFSSGAAVDARMKTEPYGAIKSEIEGLIAHHPDPSLDVRVLRLWNVTGPLAPRPDDFAITNFINQAFKTGKIEINSDHEVWRRYAPIEECLTAVLLDGPRKLPLDSGGELIELRQLANQIASTMPFEVTVESALTSADASHYYSESDEYERILSRNGIAPSGLQAQIRSLLSERPH
jgi:nucleoside-diphosphate-sugar epimerase